MLVVLKNLYHKYVFLRRINVLSTLITQQIPNNFNILDIGCGDGKISKMIIEKEKTITISGIDVFARETCAIPLKLFDGKTIPFADNEYDASILVDVLHHTNNIKDLLSEACRVSRQYVILKRSSLQKCT